jgi:hypothetical protein
MPVAMQVPKSYLGFLHNHSTPFRLYDYEDYLLAREWRLNVKTGRQYYDYGTRPIPLPKRLLG